VYHISLVKGLSSEDLVKLYKLAILLHPLKEEKLAKYLEIEKRIDLVRPFIKELIERTIFEKDSKWFRHELVQKCFETH
jgi:hypothetical protein